MSWKKRGQAGWNGRKAAKEVSKYKERTYAKKEIKQQLQEHEEGSDYRHSHGKRTRNKKAQIQYRIGLYEQWIARDERNRLAALAKGERHYSCSYFGGSHYRSRVEEMKKELEKIDQEK